MAEAYDVLCTSCGQNSLHYITLHEALRKPLRRTTVL